MNHKTILLGAALALSLGGITSSASTSVVWNSPPNGSTYAVGTSVTPLGQASGAGVIGGTGLDLALVIDVSGSMGGPGIAAAQAASSSLVNALPVATTSVTIIAFNSVANTVKVLSPLTTDKTAILNAIAGLAAGGGTEIGRGIQAATTELTSSRHTVGRSQQMVVLSDGFSGFNPNPATAADDAKAAGVDAIHSVGIPGHSVAQMKDIADGVDNISGNSDDNGVYTDANNLAALEGLFNGTSGNLVKLDHVDVTLPNGTTITVPTDGLGNFAAPNHAIALGPQTWVATAYGTDGSSASATLTLNGIRDTVVTPDGGSTALLLGLGMVALLPLARRSRV